METAAKWDAFYANPDITQIVPASVLVENDFLLPKSGTALDLACGLGANALFLAERGLLVSAWDISVKALDKLQRNANSCGLTLSYKTLNINTKCLPKEAFDVIIVSHFLDRTLTNAIIDSLKLGGLLFYQTFTQTKAIQRGSNNPEYLLATGELLKLFGSLNLIYYRDNALVGNASFGLRNEAQFIGQKQI